MPKSKNRTEHKQKSQQFKQTQKKQKENMQNQQQPMQMPPVISRPVWQPDAKIELTGYEFEGMQNAIAQLQEANQVMQAVLSRNLVSGNIQMDFEKLDPATLQYGPMTDEEKAPYQADFKKAIDTMKERAANPPAADTGTVEGNSAGASTPGNPTFVETPTGSGILSQEGEELPTTQAKVVNMETAR